MKKGRAASLCIAVGLLLSLPSLARSPDQPHRPSLSQKIAKVAQMNEPESIGTATMRQDRTIVLDLVARGAGLLGDARLTYAPSDQNYEAILRHLGGLRPGEVKPVRPWPDQPR